MKKLCQLVELVSNTEDAVVLKVKPNSEIDLICLGCFNGDETMFRLTKGEDVTCTVWTKNGNHYSWYWGTHGYTLVSDAMEQRGLMILETIEHGFDIRVKATRKIIDADMARKDHSHKIVFYDGGSYGACCHQDGAYLRYFKTVAEGVKFFQEYGYITRLVGQGTWLISK
jgi:hypothetical protein